MNTRVTYKALGEASIEIPIGNISSSLTFSASEYTKNITVTVEWMGWKTGVWSSKSQVTYHFVVTRRRHGGDGLKFLSDGLNLATKSNNDGNVYSVDSFSLNTVITIEAAQTTAATTTKYFQTTRTALFNGEPIPDLRSSAWKATPGQISLRSCNDDIFLVQIDGSVIMSYQINATSDSHVAIENDFIVQGTVATIELSKDVVNKYCSAGNALARAFSVDPNEIFNLYQVDTQSLTIKLHEDAGPFYLKDTLQVISRSPTLKHIQNVQYDIESAEVTLTFPAAHRQSSGTQVTLQIPGQEQVRKVIVPITVLDKTTVKVKYIDAVHSGPFRSYFFTSSTKVVCYDSVKFKKKNGETIQLAVSDFTVDANEKLNVRQGDSQNLVNTYAIVGETTSRSHQGCIQVSTSQRSTSQLAHTNVIVDKITTCPRASGCTYYCHGGSETWDEVLRSKQIFNIHGSIWGYS